MANTAHFQDTITKGYTTKGDAIILGTAMLDGHPIEGAHVNILTSPKIG